MKVVRIIASNLQETGINVTPTFPDYNNYNDKLSGGNNLDPAISNSNSKVSNTVWSPWLFHPVQKGLQTSGNHWKFNSPEVFRIVDELDGTPPGNTEKYKQIISRISKIFLDDMPDILLWFNEM